MVNKVELQFVMQLNRIFKEKKWSEIENYEYVYESLCNLSSILSESEDEHKLFLELIDRYTWMSFGDYSVKVKKLLESFLITSGINFSKFYTFPAIKPEDEKKNKSGNTISYMIKCNKPFIKNVKHIRFEELTQFSEFENLKLRDNEYIVLVDDYIGSGETLFACINEIESRNKDLKDRIIVASIVIQHDTIPKIKIPLHYVDIVKKGISDCYNSPEKEKHLKTMTQLETKLISGRNFSLGYEQSEGLVTMMRTPDNTFPIFWHEFKKSTNLLPPFPRE